MIPILAWRNIWRSPTRSLVVIAAIAIGIWAALFMTGFASGMVKGYVENAISRIVSHLQIHHPDYEKDFDVRMVIPQGEKIAEELAADPAVKAVSARTLITGMVASAKGARGIRVKAVDPQQETLVSGLDQRIRSGDYFGDRRNELLLGRKLAEELGVEVRSKVVLTFQDLQGNITAGAFRVIGLFESGNQPFDESTLFIRRGDADRLLRAADAETADTAPATGAEPTGALIHEIALLVQEPAQVDALRNRFQSAFPESKVQTYREISPDLELYEGQMQTVSIIYLTIIMLALIFGIINTMLMAVLERLRELGMLMAIGMNKGKVFSMIVLETILLGVIGAPLGLLLGYGTVAYFGRYGLNLSAFSDTLSMYGMSDKVYFFVDQAVYYQVPVAVAITAVLASLYPAFKAIRLKPVDAVRYF